MSSDKDKSESSVMPDFPGERPDRQAFDAWFDSASSHLTRVGYGSLIRGEVPYELRKLAPRPLLVVPSDAAAAVAIVNKNVEIEYANAVNKLDVDARTQEMQARFGAVLFASFKGKAKLRWKSLADKHCFKDGAGVPVPGSVNGSLVWKDIAALRTAALGTSSAKAARKMVEKLRDSRLDNNCSPDEWAARVRLLVENNDMLDVPMAAIELSEFVMGMGPSDWASDFRRIKAAMVVADTWKVPVDVVSAFTDFVESAHEAGVAPSISMTAAALEQLKKSAASSAVAQVNAAAASPGATKSTERKAGWAAKLC
jgi:hypothetical protein